MKIVRSDWSNSKRNKKAKITHNKLMDLYAQDTHLMHTIELNRISTINIVNTDTYRTIKKSLSDFDKDAVKLNQDFHHIKSENDLFSHQFKSEKNIKAFFKGLKVPKKAKKKEELELDTFNELIKIYKKRGYKIPDLSVKHNIFKIEPLLEENESKIKDGFIVYPNLQKKNVNYLQKLIDFVDNLLHPDKQKELLQPSMSTNYLPKNDFITKTTHKRNRTLQEEKVEQSNTLTTHCLSYNQLSIAEQIELDNENKETLEQISKLLNLLNQVEPIKPTVKRSNVNLQGKFNLFLKSPIRNLKTNKLYTPRNAFLNSNINNDKKSRPPSNISVMSCKRNTSRRTSLSKKGKRGSLLNIKLPKISVELEAKNKFGKFKNEKDFLEFAYHKLINNEYQLVYEMLKLFLKNNRHYDDKSIETTLECKNVLCPTTLYNDIKGLSSQLKTTKMEDKIKRLYLNSEYYYSILPKLKKLEGSDKQLSDMDKYLVQTITNKE